MSQRPYQSLVVWKEAHALCLHVYASTKNFPPEERFGLTSQMRRSAYSIPTNIAEGNGRKHQKERIHFIDIASGSLEELHYQALLARDLEYIRQEELEQVHDLVQRVGFLLHRLRQSLT